MLADLFQMPRIDGFLSATTRCAVYEELLGRELVGTNWWHVFALAKMAAEIHRMLRQTRKLDRDADRHRPRVGERAMPCCAALAARARDDLT